MPRTTLTRRQQKTIEAAVSHFQDSHDRFAELLDILRIHITGSAALKALIHSVKYRVKDPDHLRQKLIRQALEARRRGKEFSISKANLFTRINDLAGFRILHLHTRQFADINRALLDLFQQQRYNLLEGPTARTWDDESREYFRTIGVKTQVSPSMYTSVHYVIEANSQKKYTCEVQVRTLAEELWGEVDHTLNYPTQTDSVSCREQIKVLARVTSSCTRLVDAIFTSHASPLAVPPSSKRRTTRRR